jgi:hypothetical protein
MKIRDKWSLKEFYLKRNIPLAGIFLMDDERHLANSFFMKETWIYQGN